MLKLRVSIGEVPGRFESFQRYRSGRGMKDGRESRMKGDARELSIPFRFYMLQSLRAEARN